MHAGAHGVTRPTFTAAAAAFPGSLANCANVKRNRYIFRHFLPARSLKLRPDVFSAGIGFR